VTVDDALNRRQTDTCAGKIADLVETLKCPKEFTGVRHIKSRAIITYKKDLSAVRLCNSPDLDQRLILFGGKFPGIIEQILEHDPQKGGIGVSGEPIGNAKGH
jgi:hypothetical protein